MDVASQVKTSMVLVVFFSHFLLLVYAMPCELRRESALKSKRFEAEYLEKQPVIIEAARSMHYALRKLDWGPEGFTKRYGDLQSRLVDKMELSRQGSRAREIATVSVRDYVGAIDTWKLPLFENSQEKLSLVVSGDINFRALPVSRLRVVRVVSLGSVNTSIDFHAHGQNFLAQVHGRKAWLLAEPGKSPNLLKDPCDYQNTLSHSSIPLSHCVLHPGEILYVPSKWWHATCNLDNWTFAFGGEGDISTLPAAHAAVIDDNIRGLRQAVKNGKEVLGQPGCNADCFFVLLKGTPVHIAVGHRNLAMLEELRNLGADLQKDMTGVSRPLHVAAVTGHVSIVEWLVDEGTPVNQTDMSGMTALHLASYFGRLSVIEWLHKHSTNILELRNDDGELPIHLAAKSGQEDATQMLLTFKRSHSLAQDGNGRTPGDIAVDAGHAHLARILNVNLEL